MIICLTPIIVFQVVWAAPPTIATSLKGVVTDKSGAPLKDVSVVLHEINRGTITDADGSYRLGNLPVGICSVVYSRIGYAPRVNRIEFAAGEVTLNISLRETVIQMPGMQITASANLTSLLTSPQSTGAIDENELRTAQDKSLGETVSKISGVRSWNTGAGIGKPVIRGLGSDRVLVTIDGLRQDSQQWGDEHGPNVETSDLERIEVIRGPASVLYGSDALGGVVNLIPRPLPSAIDRDMFVRGRTFSAYGSNNYDVLGGATLEGARGGFGFRGAWYGRNGDNIKTPGGLLANSGYESNNGSAAVGYRGAWGSIEARYSHRREKIQIHEDPEEDPEATPFQRIQQDDIRIDASLPVNSRSRVELNLAFAQNRRREFEEVDAPDVALGLLSKSLIGHAHYHHPPMGPWEGLLGVSVLRNTFDKFGEETLIPNTRATNFALFLFEQTEIDNWHFSFGARVDLRNLKVEEDETLDVSAQTRNYESFTGNFGVLYHLSEPVALAFNLGRGFRAPSSFDLFSNGVHEGTVAYERGNPALDTETSLNADLLLRIQTTKVSAEFNAYVNRINNYIYSRPSGEFDPGSGYQIYNTVQGDSRLEGFEAQLEHHFGRYFHVRAGADMVRGRNLSSGTPLTWIPPLRLMYGLRIEPDSAGRLREIYLELGGNTYTRQTRLDPEETGVPGYTLAHFRVGMKIPYGRRGIMCDLSVHNLLDKRYSNFLSRFKAYALDQGRSVVLRVGVDF